MDPKTRITSAKAMEDEYFQDKVDGLPQGNQFETHSLYSLYNIGPIQIVISLF